MGAPQEVLQEIFTVIEGGNTIGTSAEIIQFPADNGSGVFNVIQKTIKGANGTGLNYWVSAVASGASALSAGALYITCTFPEFIALAVPCLGIAVGTIWYNMAPEFWEGIANKLIDAGYTVKGKVVGYMNTQGNLTFPEDAIKIVADDLIEAGVFKTGETVLPEGEQSELFYPGIYSNVNMKPGLSQRIAWETHNAYGYYEMQGYFSNSTTSANAIYTGMLLSEGGQYISPIALAKLPFSVDFTLVVAGLQPSTFTMTGEAVTRNGQTYYVACRNGAWEIDASYSIPSSATQSEGYFNNQNCWDIMYIMENGIYEKGNEDVLQNGATYPKPGINWRDLFPDWLPWEFPLIPISGGDPFRLPPGLPVEYPNNLPIEQPYQVPAQTPGNNAEENPDDVEETIKNPEHDPRTEYQPKPAPETDPDTGSEDENIDEEKPDDQPDPIEPDPGTPITPVIPVPLPPSTVDSNKMFTVYNPTPSQLDQLGGYLWDNDLIDVLRKIWQNPMDGIIGLSQIYCTPSTGSPHNIILGYLDSGVSSKVVTNQFAHIDCGEVEVPELNQNATDYNPYVAIHIYLPFIGITELDINDFMGGRIGVKYHIDVYTGTCLAEVKMKRTRDVPSGGIIYTFTGNCSQQLPLTSGDQKGLLSVLIGAAGVALGIASGGASLAAAGGTAAAQAARASAAKYANGAMIAHEAGRDVNREMMHVSHSGNLSANAGIMGQKKPYIIIVRQKPYNANSYGKFYGYPANKTVFLSNFTGFCKVKAARLRSKATEAEKAEILQLCSEGIIM